MGHLSNAALASSLEEIGGLGHVSGILRVGLEGSDTALHQKKGITLANIPAQAEFLLHSLEQVARGIDLYVNSDKAEFMRFNQDCDILLNGKFLKLVNYFTYPSSNIPFTESNENICIGKALTAIDRLMPIRKINHL